MNIDKLKSVIQEANPEIMGLGFGCEFRMGENLYTHKILDYISPGIFIVWYPGAGTKQIDWTEFKDNQETGRYKILGRPIRLADVLLAGGSNIIFEYELAGDWFSLIDYDDDDPKTVFMWNLKDDNLDHQSDETKQSLIELLT